MRKVTSLIPYLAFYGGARWADLLGAKWENIKWYKPHSETRRRSAVIRIPTTKNNAIGLHHTSYPISEQKLTMHNSLWDCPYRALLRHYVYMGYPSSGYLFVTPEGQQMTVEQSHHVFCTELLDSYPPN